MAKLTKKLRLLIADDHELVREGTRRILRTHRGWAVVGEAVDGRDAVQKAESLRPDLAILDIAMPNLDGLEATRQILRTAPTTKILILTMHESSQMVRLVLEAGAKGYVLKSDLAANLVEAVKIVSQGKTSLTAKVSEIVSRGPLRDPKDLQRSGKASIRPSPREFEVIRFLAQGQSSKEIASHLNLSKRTVEVYRARLMHKLDLKSVAAVIRYAIRNNIIEV